MQQAIRPLPLVGSAKSRVWRSAAWVAYYRRNGDTLARIPWEEGAELTAKEKQAIAKSVQGFQLGESSEGHHLQHAAEAWGGKHSDGEYAEAIRLFIQEEQRHSRELGRFLEMNGIPLIEKSWTDSLFRSVRRAAGLELSIVVLLTAEIVAQVYYVALREATGSRVLQTICDQILRDEEEHVRFQSERLAILARDYSPARIALRFLFQRLLMAVTLPIVWSVHRHALYAGGYSFARFASATWRAFGRAAKRMDPRGYDWSTHRG